MRRIPIVAAFAVALLPSIGTAATLLEISIRPKARPAVPETVVARLATSEPATPAPRAAGFGTWIDGIKARAAARGISRETVDAAFAGVTYDADVIRRDRNQSEFTKTIWDYLDTAVSDLRVTNGREALGRHEAVLDQIETRYGVPKEVVVAVWGLESAYGTFRGESSVIQSLATLAYDGRRGAFFEAQLWAALEILDAGDTAPSNMKGSWAGASGHTQFMPTSFLDYAVDFTGDGRRDIWGEDPTDALASTANYLARHGWTPGVPWGVEVVLPDGFDFSQTGHPVKKGAADWAELGVRDTAGEPVPDHGPASVILPGGSDGAVFMVFANFAVIERYNPADAYVIGVGHLADRIAGGPSIRSDWPRHLRALSFDERKEIQRRLTSAGFDTRGIDGLMGPLTEEAIRGFQRSIGVTPDGYASTDLLARLR
ncbi:MAG: lytic murein transglycosylase [Pseudomonadota bacterium]